VQNWPQNFFHEPAELVVDDDDGVVDGVEAVGVLAKQDVSALEVVVTKDEWWVNTFNCFSEKETKRLGISLFFQILVTF